MTKFQPRPLSIPYRFKCRGISNAKMVIGYFFEDNTHGACIRHPDGQSFFIDYKTLGQSTELDDENGKEIFEGDIVEFDSINPDGDDCVETCVVHYSVETSEYILMYKKGSPDSLSARTDAIRVIGNIHQNPELFTK